MAPDIDFYEVFALTDNARGTVERFAAPVLRPSATQRPGRASVARRVDTPGTKRVGLIGCGNPLGMPYHIGVMNLGHQAPAGICPGATALVQRQRRVLITAGAAGDKVAWRAR
jgi:hypothetical protein